MTEDGLRAWEAMPRGERVRRCVTRLRREFDEGYRRATGCPWPLSSRRDELLTSVATWVVDMGGNPKLVIQRLLAGFFASNAAREKRYPLPWLAHDPVEYYQPEPARPSELKRLRAEREGRQV